jgi:hypothetical protein
MSNERRAAVLSSVAHRDLRRKTGTFFYLDNQPLVPVSVVEAPVAALDLPLVFTRDENDRLGLMALLSLNPKDNVHVGPKGLWMGGYMPVVVRTHPFGLYFDGDRATVVVVEDSDWLSTGEGDPLFDHDGKPTPLLNSITELLKKRFPHPHRDIPVLEAIAQSAILEPLGQVSDRLLKINPDKLAGLDDQAFLKLRKKNALPVVYAHLMSLSRIQRIQNLAQRKEQMREHLVKHKKLPDGEFSLRVEDDMISFD